ncbi:hypothetical protein ACS0TY_028422 [Phlomoides rotata]
MGCVSSKKARSQSPAFDDVYSGCRHSSAAASAASGSLSFQESIGQLEKIREEAEEKEEEGRESGIIKRHQDYNCDDYSDNLRGVQREKNAATLGIQFERMAEAEFVAAGWPPWLASVAGDAIQGWLPLRSDAYERLDKIGQGTYSNVYRARDLKTGNTVAVKKVRFDNFHPESVKFMAREILILRKLNHPNIMKLEGIITSRLSCTVYLVFEYMEHDLAGLLSCPQVKFTDSQIKCLMKQLLSGLGHCHSRGIMHRDIKCSNILVNNEGVLKIADFGLAYFTKPKDQQPLTSRVVTLWYRPPELLLGSTSYCETVDLWSAGCVFAELFIGRPILKGRNEVEQLHKIFKLCGSPSDDYWKTSKLPLATMFKPQQPYESTLVERCKEFPKGAVCLIEMLLSVEPHKRGSASSALDSEYFNTKPYACEPSSMPKFPPNKEIDAKARDEARRNSLTTRPAMISKNPRRARKTLHESSDFCKVVPTEEVEPKAPQLARVANAQRRRSGVGSNYPSLKQSCDTKSDLSIASHTSQESISSVRSVPAQMTASSGFAWAKRTKQQDVFTRLYTQPTIREGQENEDRITQPAKLAIKKQARLNRHDSFDSSDIYFSQDLSEDYANKKKTREGLFSGPLVYQSQENGLTQYDQARQVPRRSRFHKD